jgi:hypothetical protein
MKNIKTFAAKSNVSEKLIRAIVRQAGGWITFKEMAADVANHGADSGFNGFIYYTETAAFYARNRPAILEYAGNMASELGEGLVEMVRNFNCLGDEFTPEEIGQTLYGSRSKHNTQVANALAWFALEEVARSFVNCAEAE